MDLQPGAAFGRYTIESELGRGGMGQVLLAIDRVLYRKVALKILLPGLREKEEVVARFFREARLAAQLAHPNTVHVYDLGEASGHPFIAMEYVDGSPLTSYVGRSCIPAHRRLRWLVDVAKGLGAAHARGLLHRDVKPSNVIVSKDDIAKVVDFGLAKKGAAWFTRHDLPKVGQAAWGTRHDLPKVGEAAWFTRHDLPKVAHVGNGEMRATFQTATGFVIGTPAYMAPEQLDPTATIDARADQFSWALTAYALMLGKNLRKEDPLLFGPIPLLSDHVPGVSRRAAEIILRALSNDREMRFPSMDALVAELEPAIVMQPSARSRLAQAPPTGGSDRPAAVSRDPTPRMASVPPPVSRFCPECGVSFGMSSPRCKGPHAEAFPRPPGVEDEG